MDDFMMISVVVMDDGSAAGADSVVNHDNLDELRTGIADKSWTE